ALDASRAETAAQTEAARKAERALKGHEEVVEKQQAELEEARVALAAVEKTLKADRATLHRREGELAKQHQELVDRASDLDGGDPGGAGKVPCVLASRPRETGEGARIVPKGVGGTPSHRGPRAGPTGVAGPIRRERGASPVGPLGDEGEATHAAASRLAGWRGTTAALQGDAGPPGGGRTERSEGVGGKGVRPRRAGSAARGARPGTRATRPRASPGERRPRRSRAADRHRGAGADGGSPRNLRGPERAGSDSDVRRGHGEAGSFRIEEDRGPTRWDQSRRGAPLH